MSSCVSFISGIVFVGAVHDCKKLQGIVFFGVKKAHFFELASKVVALMDRLKENGSSIETENGHFYKLFEKVPADKEGLEAWVEDLFNKAK